MQQQIGSFGNYRTSMDATGPVTTDGAFLYRMNMSYQTMARRSPADLTHAQDIFLAPEWNIDPATWVKLEGQYDDNKSDQFFSDDPIINGVFVPITRSRNYSEGSPHQAKGDFCRAHLVAPIRQ